MQQEFFPSAQLTKECQALFDRIASVANTVKAKNRNGDFVSCLVDGHTISTRDGEVLDVFFYLGAKNLNNHTHFAILRLANGPQGPESRAYSSIGDEELQQFLFNSLQDLEPNIIEESF